MKDVFLRCNRWLACSSFIVILSNIKANNLRRQGFGGKFEYFGLFVSADFGHGFTAPTCTTFESRQLSGKKRFQIDVIEVWGVGPKPKKVDDDSVSARTGPERRVG